jgi:hypothetical protein
LPKACIRNTSPDCVSWRCQRAPNFQNTDDRLGTGFGRATAKFLCAVYHAVMSRGTIFVVFRFVNLHGHSRPVFALLIFMESRSICQEWRDYRPSVRSEVVKLQASAADSLLTNFCTVTERSERFGYTCRTGSLGTKFADMTDRPFRPQGAVFGHFVGPYTTDAVVSGSSAESHPYHWGGTLLLTQRDKKWIPLWYKSGLITNSCAKASRPDGREILICEFEDGGMGHRYHSLYGVDLLRPSATTALGQADSFQSDFCSAQRQVMEALTWDTDYRSFSVVIQTPEWHRLPGGVCGPHPPKRPPLSVRLEFNITDEGIKPRISH